MGVGLGWEWGGGLGGVGQGEDESGLGGLGGLGAATTFLASSCGKEEEEEEGRCGLECMHGAVIGGACVHRCAADAVQTK